MSKPLAATSDAIKNLIDSSLKPFKTSILVDCSRSPWIAPTLKPWLFIDFINISTSILRLQNIIPFLHLFPSLSIISRNKFRFSLNDRSLRLGLNEITPCVIVSEIVACFATSILTGAERNSSVILVISGAIVAEKNSVCLVNGVNLNILSISGINPISNIRSASSTTIILTPVRRSFPRSK